MASALDSKAYFEERLVAMGLAELKEAFQQKGWNTLGNFAFAIPPVAQADDALFQAKVLRPLLGEGDDPREASVRRLHFEAHTVAVADVRRWPVVAPVQRIVRGEGRADRSQAHLGDSAGVQWDAYVPMWHAQRGQSRTQWGL